MDVLSKSIGHFHQNIWTTAPKVLDDFNLSLLTTEARRY